MESASSSPGTQPPLDAGLIASVLPGNTSFHPLLHSTLPVYAYRVTTACLDIASRAVDTIAA